jgi:1,4-dihydroxy-2-naphthoate octaprenyltransferase
MSTDVSTTRAWILAARPQTLPAGAAPVVVGTAVAVHESIFAPIPALAALIGALLIQVGTNFANDYYDAVKGVDTDDREGFTRATQSGLIPAGQVKGAAFGSFGLAFLVGCYLVSVGGLPILVIGLASLVSGYAYAGGPYPLGSHGLGDLFVFVFFGVVAVTGTVYVQAAAALAEPLATTIPASVLDSGVLGPALVASLPMAALTTNVLVVNNIRDIETDRAAGKRTLAVMIGYQASRAEYVGLLGLAYLAPLILWVGFDYPLAVVTPLVTVPYAALVARTVCTRSDGEALNPALEQTGRLVALYALLFAVGLFAA